MEGKVKVCKVEVDKNPDLASEYEIRSIPTMILVKDGEVTERIEGARTREELVDKLQAL